MCRPAKSTWFFLWILLVFLIRSPGLYSARNAFASGASQQQVDTAPAAGRKVESLNSERAVPAGTPVAVEMRNVNFRFAANLALYIATLNGNLLPARGVAIPTFDDKRSFFIDVSSGEVAIDAKNLESLLNTYVFADPGSGLKKIRVSMDGQQLTQKATAHKGIDLPVELTATLSVTPAGKLRIHTTKIHAAHIPFKGLMNVFGMKLSDFIHQEKTHGISISGNDIILDPETALPPPHIHARLASVRIEGQRIVQTLASERSQISAASSPASQAVPQISAVSSRRGFMKYNGGVLKFGKLTMRPAELAIFASQAGRPFDFFLDHYQQQLAAGVTKATPDYGWVVYMPGYASLKR